MNLLYVRCRRSPGPGTMLATASAIILFVVGLSDTDRTAFAVLGAIPAVFAGIGAIRHPWNFRLEINDEGLVVADGRKHLFSELKAVCIPRWAQHSGNSQYPINAVFADDIVSIPSQINMASDQIVELLDDRLPDETSEYSCAALGAFHRNQTEVFGAEQVWSCQGRAVLGWIPRRNILIPCGIFILAIACFMFVGGFVAKDAKGAAIAGVMILFVGSVILGLGIALRNRAQRKWGPKSAYVGIVITPAAMAVAQGDLVGQLRWDEILDVTYPASSPQFQIIGNDDAVCDAIDIKVAGDSIRLLDLYDRPLYTIFHLIEERRGTKSAATT